MIAYMIILFAPKLLRRGLEVLKDSPFLVREPDVVLGEPDVISKLEIKSVEKLKDFLELCHKVEGLVKTSTMVSLTPLASPNTNPIDAYVFITSGPLRLNVEDLKKIGGIVEAHEILGNFDYICEVKSEEPNVIKGVCKVASQIRAMPQVMGTVTYLVGKKEDLPEEI